MMQALERGGKWYSLYDKVCLPEVLARSWRRVAANGGSAGVDGVDIARFERNAEERLHRLSEALKHGSHRPQPIRRVEIPKSDGGTRPLGIPTLTDRVVQGALREVIEPIFESRFLPCSYGFRPGRGCKDALRAVQVALDEGLRHVVDADLSKYFDSIPHQALMDRIGEHVADGAVMKLIRAYLKQEVMADMQTWQPEGGTPQGAVLSPLLANIYLHPLDQMLTRAGYRLVRYADDFVVLTADADAARSALGLIDRWVRLNGLTLHPSKTRLADLGLPGGWFDFLGYRFATDDQGKLVRMIKPKKLKALRTRLAQLTRRILPIPTTDIIARLNLWLQGVFGYFKHARARDLVTLDAHVRFRLRRIFVQRLGNGGSARHRWAHTRWPNDHFHKLGLFSLARNRVEHLRSLGGHT